MSRNKAYTAIDVFGLSVSLMFVLLIAVYTTQELSTDKFQTESDRIYALAHEGGPTTALPIAYRLQNRYPEIEKVTGVDFEASYLDQQVQETFDAQIRIVKIITVFANPIESVKAN